MRRGGSERLRQHSLVPGAHDCERIEESRTKRETLDLVRNIAACPPEIQRRFRALLLSISEFTTQKD